MVEITESPSFQRGISFREAGKLNGERALAIKQGWSRVFDVLDINLAQGLPSYENAGDNKDALAQQPINTYFSSEEFSGCYDERESAQLEGVSIDGTERRDDNSELYADLALTTHKVSTQEMSTSIQHNSSFFIKPIADSTLVFNGHLAPVYVAPTQEILQIAAANPAVVGFGMDRAIGNISNNAFGSLLNSTGLIIKKDTEIVQPSQVSLAKSDGGYMILARDYRIHEKVLTKKLVDSLKSILLAGGALKKILMNGKTEF